MFWHWITFTKAGIERRLATIPDPYERAYVRGFRSSAPWFPSERHMRKKRAEWASEEQASRAYRASQRSGYSTSSLGGYDDGGTSAMVAAVSSYSPSVDCSSSFDSSSSCDGGAACH